MSLMDPMDTPTTRAEFERKFHILSEIMREGRLGLSPQAASSAESMKAVRVLPNGRIDFLSVDESARLMANTMAQSMFDGEHHRMAETLDDMDEDENIKPA